MLRPLFLTAAILHILAPWALALDPFQESGGHVVMEAENYDAKIPRIGKEWTFFSSAGSAASGTGYLRVLPNTAVTTDTGYTTLSPELKYQINFTTAGTYYVWIRGRGPTTNDNTLHGGIDGSGPASADKIGIFPSSWSWRRSTMDGPVAMIVVGSPGVHSFHLWMREDGFIVDKILLTTSSSYIPSGMGPPESPRVDTTPPDFEVTYPAEGSTIGQ